MTYTPEERHAYYIRRREYHLNYSKEFVKRHRDKYIAYYKEYNHMKSELVKMLSYKDTEPSVKPKPKPIVPKEKKPKGEEEDDDA